MAGVRDVALVVQDLGRVAEFYRQVIGLAVIEAAPGRTVLGAGGVGFLVLLERPDAWPVDKAAAGLFHTAFLLPDRPALGAWLRHVAALDQVLDGAADHSVSEAVYLHDPEGNGIEVYADRPAAAWRWTDTPDGRRVVMANAPLDRTGLLALPGRWDGAPEGTRIGHVHLQVGAIPEAEAFYAGRLGLDVTATRAQAVFMSTGGYHHHLAVNTWNSLGAGARDPRRAGLASVTLEGLGTVPAEATDPWGTTFRFVSTDRDMT